MTGTVEDELGNGRVLLVHAKEMAESRFTLSAKYIWKLKALLEHVAKSRSPLLRKDAAEILAALEENVLSGAKGSNRS